MNDLLSVPDVARRLRMTADFVRYELRENHLRGSKIGGTWRVRESDLEAYVSARANITPVRGRSA